MKFKSILTVSALLLSSPALAEPENFNDKFKHAHLMHLDGFRGDVFQDLLEQNMLPTFRELLDQGKYNTKASTVDKSETMKVIQSYLTSKRDTKVVGWWQFNRDKYTFRNFWLDPAEVINYELGLDFPVYPTIFDFIRSRGDMAASGFGLHRRSVHFTNYTRNYVEGAKAVFDHTYYDQAHSTMQRLIDLYDKRSKEDGPFPVFATSLLAASDEFGHLEGTALNQKLQAQLDSRGFINRGKKSFLEACLSRIPDKEGRDDKTLRRIFEILDEGLKEKAKGGFLSKYKKAFFEVKRLEKGGISFCTALPRTQFYMEPAKDEPIGKPSLKYAAFRYVLGMILIDIELGRLVDKMKSIKVADQSTLFDRTLFVFLGDHGMAETPKQLDTSFVGYLKKHTGLEVPDKEKIAQKTKYVLDNEFLPLNLRFPHLDKSWQSKATQEKVSAANKKAKHFMESAFKALKSDLYRKYWFFLFLTFWIVDSQFEKQVAEYRPIVEKQLTRLYLQGDPEYAKAESMFLEEFYQNSVGLVYGGGARNNAELFLPATINGKPSWKKRPTYQDIVSNPTLTALKKTPSVGLIFVRLNNELYQGQLPKQGKILVMDRKGRKGIITVNERRGIPVYSYSVANGSYRNQDPLNYGQLSKNQGTTGTYDQWNTWSIQANHYYHNAVAGMASYLHSTNPSIGDITVLHSQGWNFGDNASGHGGIHQEEKLTLMAVSGKGIRPGAEPGKDLMSWSRYQIELDGTLVKQKRLTYPTVTDAMPTILKWLYDMPSFEAVESKMYVYNRSWFAGDLRKWMKGQRKEMVDHIDEIDGVDDYLKSQGFNRFKLSKFNSELKDLTKFMPNEVPKIPDPTKYQLDGNLLKLD